MVKNFAFTGMLCEDTKSLLLIPYRADHAKDPQDLTSMHWEVWTSFQCFGNM